MDSLTHGRIAGWLAKLHQEADAADRPMKERIMAAIDASGKSLEEFFAEKIANDKKDYKASLGGMAAHFLAVSPSYGRFLYTCARAARATRIIEFGTSMGIDLLMLDGAFPLYKPILKLVESQLRACSRSFPKA